MAYTNPVADFVSSLDSFYESVSIDDLEMVVGPIDRVNANGIEKADSSSIISINEHHSIADTDIDEECFHDVMESTELKKSNIQNVNHCVRSNEYIDDLISNNHIPISQQNGSSSVIQFNYPNELVEEFQLQIKNTVSTMKYDLDVIANKCAQLELKLSEISSKSQNRRQVSRFKLYQMIFLIGWPIFIQLIFVWFQRRNRR